MVISISSSCDALALQTPSRVKELRIAAMETVSSYARYEKLTVFFELESAIRGS
jgi:hypothetical protein